jgi:hypothetical protein
MTQYYAFCDRSTAGAFTQSKFSRFEVEAVYKGVQFHLFAYRFLSKLFTDKHSEAIGKLGYGQNIFSAEGA